MFRNLNSDTVFAQKFHLNFTDFKANNKKCLEISKNNVMKKIQHDLTGFLRTRSRFLLKNQFMEKQLFDLTFTEFRFIKKGLHKTNFQTQF